MFCLAESETKGQWVSAWKWCDFKLTDEWLKVSGNCAAVLLELIGGSTDACNYTGQCKYVRRKHTCSWVSTHAVIVHCGYQTVQHFSFCSQQSRGKKINNGKNQADNQISELPSDHCNNWKLTFIEMREKSVGAGWTSLSERLCTSLLCGLKAHRRQTNSAYLIW